MSKADKLKKLRQEETKSKDLQNSIKQADELFGKTITVSEMVKEGDEVPLFARRNGKYSIDEKHLALMFMKGIQEDKGNGKLVPKFAHIGKMLGLKRQTLHKWWESRNLIEKQHSSIMDEGMRFVGSALMLEMFRMVQSLKQIDYTDLFSKPSDLKNFISLMNIVANKALMYNSKPTSKVEHQHTGGVAMVLPE
tara:strand:+ start:19 stop:600 length:582 start_codon:yes stop_codon:yes gene_type:complete